MKKAKLLTLLAVPFLLAGCGEEEIAPKGPKVETRYSADNSIEEKNEYSYDKNGNPVEILSAYYIGGVALKSKVTLEYNGNLLAREYSYSQKEDSSWDLKYKAYYSYDENGKEKVNYAIKIADNGEEVPSNIEFSNYNDKNLLIHTESYRFAKGEFTPLISVYYEYNDKGLLVSERRAESYYTESSILQQRFEYVYNADDTLKEVKEYSGYLENGKMGEEKLNFITSYEYDAKKNKISETCHGFDDLNQDYVKTKETYEYDDKNRMIKSSYFNLPDDETVTDLVLDSYTIYEY